MITLEFSEKILGILSNFLFFLGCEIIHDKEKELGVESKLTQVAKNGLSIPDCLLKIRENLDRNQLNIASQNYVKVFLNLYKDNPQKFKIGFQYFSCPIPLKLTYNIDNVVDESSAEDFLCVVFCFQEMLGYIDKFRAKSITDLEYFLGIRETKMPTINTIDHITMDTSTNQKELDEIDRILLFKDNNIIPFGSSIIPRLINQAILNRKATEYFIKDPTDGVGLHKYKSPFGYVELSLKTDVAGFLLFEEACKILDGLGPEAALINLYLTARLLQANNIQDRIKLRASDVIKDLGWDRLKRISYADKLKKLSQIIFTLGCFHTKFEWTTYVGKKQLLFKDSGLAWFVSFREVYDKAIIEGVTDDLKEIIITVSGGVWVDSFLNKIKYNSKPRESLYEYSYLCKQITQIDTYHNELAFRIALQIAIDNRIGNSTYKVGTLLKSNYSAYDLSLATKGIDARKKRYKSEVMRKNWDRALECLYGLGYTLGFDAETYPEYLRPKSLRSHDYTPPAKKPRNLINQLMEALITIHQPGIISEKILAVKQKASTFTESKKSIPTSKKSLPDSEHIKQAIKDLKLSQAKVAGILGVSKGRLVRFLSGNTKALNPKQIEHLKHILNL